MTETTGAKLSALRKRANKTLSQIAADANLAGPSSVQSYFRQDYDKPLQLTMAVRLARCLVGFGDPPIEAEEILSLAVRPEQFSSIANLTARVVDLQHRADQKRRVAPADSEFMDVTEIRQMPAPSLKGQPKDVPAFASVLAADLNFDSPDNGLESIEISVFQMNEIIAYVRRPPGISEERSVYVVFVSGSSMFPRYRQSDPVFVDPKRPPAIGDDVVVQLHDNEDSGDIVSGLIKTLVKRTSSYLELEQYQPATRFRVPMSKVAHLHRVIPWAECFGI